MSDGIFRVEQLVDKLPNHFAVAFAVVRQALSRRPPIIHLLLLQSLSQDGLRFLGRALQGVQGDGCRSLHLRVFVIKTTFERHEELLGKKLRPVLSSPFVQLKQDKCKEVSNVAFTHHNALLRRRPILGCPGASRDGLQSDMHMQIGHVSNQVLRGGIFIAHIQEPFTSPVIDYTQ
jgi:hypothetical protein